MRSGVLNFGGIRGALWKTSWACLIQFFFTQSSTHILGAQIYKIYVYILRGEVIITFQFDFQIPPSRPFFRIKDAFLGKIVIVKLPQFKTQCFFPET